MSGPPPILRLEDARRPDTGYLRALADRGFAKIEMIVSVEIAQRIALNTERLQGSMRDLTVIGTLLMEQLGIDEVTFSNEQLIGALERAGRMMRRFTKDGALVVGFTGEEESTDAQADAVAGVPDAAVGAAGGAAAGSEPAADAGVPVDESRRPS